MATINRDYGRRPELYNEEDKSNRDMMQDITELAMRGAGLVWPHSEFKKPSWENNHEAMERIFSPQQPRMGGFSLSDSPLRFRYTDRWPRHTIITHIPDIPLGDGDGEPCDCKLWESMCITIPPEERTGFCLDCELVCIENEGREWCNEKLQIIVPSGDIDQTTQNSSKQYFAVDDDGNNMTHHVEWRIDEGTGATISDSGVLVTSGTACGTITMLIDDDCGNTYYQEVRVTDSGQWNQIDLCAPDSSCWSHQSGTSSFTTATGKYRYTYQQANRRCDVAYAPCNDVPETDCPTSGCEELCICAGVECSADLGSKYEWLGTCYSGHCQCVFYIKKDEWICL